MPLCVKLDTFTVPLPLIVTVANPWQWPSNIFDTVDLKVELSVACKDKVPTFIPVTSPKLWVVALHVSACKDPIATVALFEAATVTFVVCPMLTWNAPEDEAVMLHVGALQTPTFASVLPEITTEPDPSVADAMRTVELPPAVRGPANVSRVTVEKPSAVTPMADAPCTVTVALSEAATVVCAVGPLLTWNVL